MKADKILFFFLLIVLATGCASSRLYFKPVEVIGPLYEEDIEGLFVRVPLVPSPPEPEEGPEKKTVFRNGEIFVSTLGIYLEGTEEVEGNVLHVRLLFDNTGKNEVAFLGEQSRIIENRFRVFNVTTVLGRDDESSPSMEIGPKENALYNLYFRFPQGYDPETLEHFVVKWYYLLNGREVEGLAEFNRAHRYYAHPFWGPVWYPWFGHAGFYFSSGWRW